MVYFEQLPVSCPPSDAKDIDLGIVWRLVEGVQPKSVDFLSHAAMGKNNTSSATDCRWASCSLFRTQQSAMAKTKLPRLKGFKPVGLNLPEGSGQSLVNGMHVDFWRYKEYDPLENLSSGLAA